MRFAREHGVPGQGRGSARGLDRRLRAGHHSVDPIEHNLLFERFSREMTTRRTSNIDFSTEHREQVIQYVYDKYGWRRTGMVCNVVTFQPRMRSAQVGKALRASRRELLDRLAKGVGRWFHGRTSRTRLLDAVPPPELRPQEFWSTSWSLPGR